MTAAEALAHNGWDGERLMREAAKVANDYVKANIPYLVEHRRKELIDFITERGLRAAIRFNATHPQKTYGSNGGDPFRSWVCDNMEKACVDWLRAKAEGNGDRRYNNDNRLVLSPMEDDPDPDVDFEELVSEKRLARWQAAARTTGWDFHEWVCITLDAAARQIERAAA